MKLFQAVVTTDRNKWDFDAYGATKDEAEHKLKIALRIHIHQTDHPEKGEWLKTNFSYIETREIDINKVYRNRESLIPEGMQVAQGVISLFGNLEGAVSRTLEYFPDGPSWYGTMEVVCLTRQDDLAGIHISTRLEDGVGYCFIPMEHANGFCSSSAIYQCEPVPQVFAESIFKEAGHELTDYWGSADYLLDPARTVGFMGPKGLMVLAFGGECGYLNIVKIGNDGRLFENIPLDIHEDLSAPTSCVKEVPASSEQDAKK